MAGLLFAFMFGPKLTIREKLLFTKEITTYLESGMPVLSVLEKLKDQVKSNYFRQTIEQIHDDIFNGKTFASALKEHPKVFDEFYLGLVEGGEETGKLAENMNYLTDELSKKLDHSAQLQSQMFSQVLVMGAAMSILAVVVSFLF